MFICFFRANRMPRDLMSRLDRRARHRLRITVIVANSTSLRLWLYEQSYRRILSDVTRITPLRPS